MAAAQPGYIHSKSAVGYSYNADVLMSSVVYDVTMNIIALAFDCLFRRWYRAAISIVKHGAAVNLLTCNYRAAVLFLFPDTLT